ncbi:MAG: hypothetical protein A3F13_08205 [Gammaproteobacteria bacterium RIFCSPHIGHO2_12_FULL_40_19]|nr:MAG: hypothetical protein A3F13_08205 [Gammaproteobacteria bacterium RIFCSPHIGHO2_12_FULL_40_19]
MHDAFIAENSNQKAIPIYPVIVTELSKWMGDQLPQVQQWVESSQYIAESGRSGTFCLIPNPDGTVQSVLVSLMNADDFLAFGALPAKLPEGNYVIQGNNILTTQHQFQHAALGWAFGFYQFTRYKKPMPRFAKLVLSAEIDQNHLTECVNAVYLARDLINTPAEDMGPEQLENVVKTVAKKFSAAVNVIKGDTLITENYPAIHAVGRASHREPRVIDLRWGDKSAPRVTLVGKGVCFDSGGLDLKSSAGMLLMKKDMAGSAMMLALAHMIMSQKMPVQLRLLIGAVDNAVSERSYRPGDVVATRSGKTIEITNTDAEGRMVLCDLLFEACTENPDIVVDFATLTGAARVALGEDLPAMFAQPQALADDIVKASHTVNDPIWQMPLMQSYRDKLKSEIADMVNAVESPYGGSITAALFLQSFVTEKTAWVHFDTPAWNFKLKPGRPVGADVFAVRAVFEYLKNRYQCEVSV